MKFLIALLFLAFGPATYIPMAKAKAWNWDRKWLLQAVFAFLLVPFISTLIALNPTTVSLVDVLSSDVALPAIGYGILWGIGCLTFGLSIRYLGFALGQSLALGICSAFGTLFPAISAGINLFEGKGLILLISVCISLAGISIVGYAAGLRSKQMTDDEKKAAVTEFSLTKGILVAILAGITSSCFNLGLEAGQPIREMLLTHNVNPDFALHPVVLLVTIGAFISNAAYSIFRISREKPEDKPQSQPLKIILVSTALCVLTGILFNPQFYFLSIVKNFFNSNPTILALTWSIFMSIGVIFSNLWGIVMKEWKGIKIKTLTILIAGIGLLIFSIVFPQLFK
jgi:L-rhamnose-H+ transport protein